MLLVSSLLCLLIFGRNGAEIEFFVSVQKLVSGEYGFIAGAKLDLTKLHGMG